MHTQNKNQANELILNYSDDINPVDIDSMGNVCIKLKNSENDRLLNIKLENTLVIELYRYFIEKALIKFFGTDNSVQIMSPENAPVKNIKKQLKTGNKKSELTKREKEIMRRLSNGKINKEIASELGLSVNTVRNHLRSIYTKLCVDNRTEAIVFYLNENIKPNKLHG
jgi:DNA-binding NarL/FixJ family response regulator